MGLLLWKISILVLIVMLLVIYNLNGSSRKLMMRISGYNYGKAYGNNTIVRIIDKNSDKEYLDNPKAIAKINMKPDDISKFRKVLMVMF